MDYFIMEKIDFLIHVHSIDGKIEAEDKTQK